MKAKLGFAVTAVTTVLTMMGIAQTLPERDMLARDKLALADYAKRVNRACGGTHIQFSIDYASYKPAGGVDTVKHVPNLPLEKPMMQSRMFAGLKLARLP